MSNKTVIVTGATRGLGRLIAMGAAARGERVILACRDEARGRAALAEVAALASGQPPELLLLDLSSLASVREAAAEALRRFPRIDVLVNNAGTTSMSYAETGDGFELCMGTNFLGPFLLTKLLLANMGAGSRIVNFSSAAYPWGRAWLGKPARGGVWAGFMNYAASKRAILVFTFGLARRLRERGIGVNALHPGVVRTGIMKAHAWYDAVIDLILAPFYAPADAGVEAALRLALSPDFEGVTGGYFDRGRPKSVAARFLDPALAEALIEESERLTGWTAAAGGS
jgi:NAD(P)-dependent dehydrogenase (short-subunit alcohol dehydrogenase family)